MIISAIMENDHYFPSSQEITSMQVQFKRQSTAALKKPSNDVIHFYPFFKNSEQYRWKLEHVC